jgi:ribosomal protein L21E
MIKDFVPARTSLASGVVIKQTLLERNKYPQPQVSQETVTYTGSIKSTQLWDPITQQKYISHSLIENFDGGAGGVFNTFNTVTNISQSWYETLTTPSGSVTVLHNSQDEFYDGEFSGSVLVVTTQSLAQSLPLDISLLSYNSSGSTSTSPSQGSFTWQTSLAPSGPVGPFFFIPSLHINEVDINGNNIETALSNLQAGDSITFTITGSVDDGGGVFTAYNKYTLTGLITSVVISSPSIWKINLSTGATPTTMNSTAFYYPVNVGQDINTPGNKSNTNILLNPYLNSIPNFYNSDYNPLINNTEGDRLSTKFQDVDYSTGMVTPTNFDLLISGSALKAAVQDSNYTSKRVTLPRYEGSKSTSQNLNYWTPGDEGTYGKLPTVESLKNMVAYCDWIGGWPPEKENASAIHVQYLIKSDGTVIIPNTSENSLADIKGTFETGENLFITTKTVSSGQPQQSRKVLRGGTRIEPVLYNQSGSMPGGSFVNTITLTDNNATGNVVSDFQARLGAASYTSNELNVGAYSDILFNRIINSGSAATVSSVGPYLRYQGTTGLVSEEISLQLSASLQVTDTNLGNGVFQGSYNGYVQFAIVRRRSGVTTILTQNSPSIKITQDYQPISISTSIPFNEIQNGDEFYVRGYANRSNIYVEYNSTFNIYQTPTPNASISIGNLWISSSSTTSQIQTATSGAFGTYLLFTTSSALINYYSNPSIYQQDIANSGFNPIVIPWSIKYGDEFRFEGREDRVYQIKQAAVVIGTSVGITNPLLVVELNQPVPTSGSVNFDQFLIRRYVDDASQVLMEGFAPINSQGPYIVRPEFVVPELDKSVDQFILDLTQKGLIS